jgi:hypothetical protein
MGMEWKVGSRFILFWQLSALKIPGIIDEISLDTIHDDRVENPCFYCFKILAKSSYSVHAQPILRKIPKSLNRSYKLVTMRANLQIHPYSQIPNLQCFSTSSAILTFFDVFGFVEPSRLSSALDDSREVSLSFPFFNADLGVLELLLSASDVGVDAAETPTVGSPPCVFSFADAPPFPAATGSLPDFSLLLTPSSSSFSAHGASAAAAVS